MGAVKVLFAVQDNTIHSCRTLLMQPPRSDGAPRFGSESDGVVLRFEAVSVRHLTMLAS